MWLDAFQPLCQSVLLGDQAIWFLPGTWDASGDFQGSSPRSVNSQGLKVPAAVFQSEGLHRKMSASETDAKKSFKKHWSSKPFALGETFAAKNMFEICLKNKTPFGDWSRHVHGRKGWPSSLNEPHKKMEIVGQTTNSTV